jgi:hypothetical protein
MIRGSALHAIVAPVVDLTRVGSKRTLNRSSNEFSARVAGAFDF